jgi:peptide ABC transporter ATP-binding protein
LDKNRNFLDKYPYELSGGEQQRIVIMGALIGEPSFLIADEVTTALDVETKIEVVKFFKRLREKFKISILFITHDLSTLKNFADKIYVMYHGEIVDEDHPYRKQLFQLSQDVWRRTK